MSGEPPYLVRTITKIVREFNPKFTDKIATAEEPRCVCNHVYHRHFDSYDNNEVVGCKYCECNYFAQTVEEWEKENGVELFRDPSELWDFVEISLEEYQKKVEVWEEKRDQDLHENYGQGYAMKNGKYFPLACVYVFNSHVLKDVGFEPDAILWSVGTK